MFGNNSDDGNSSIANAANFIRNVLGYEDSDVAEELEQEENDEPEQTNTVPTASQEAVGQRQQRWSLGNHSRASAIDSDEIQQAVEGVAGVDDDIADTLTDLAQMVESRDIRGFECPVCGLKHSHSDDKHDIREAFNVLAEFAEQSQFVPYCHCGVNWLAAILPYIEHMEQQVFEDQQQFEPFLTEATQADEPTAVAMFTIELQEMEEDPEVEPSIEVALEITGIEVSEEVVESADNFYTRFTKVQSASNSAPISESTRLTIDEEAGLIEEAIVEEESGSSGVIATVETITPVDAVLVAEDGETYRVTATETNVENGNWSEFVNYASEVEILDDELDVTSDEPVSEIRIIRTAGE